jgi:hypothetical protein
MEVGVRQLPTQRRGGSSQGSSSTRATLAAPPLPPPPSFPHPLPLPWLSQVAART